MKLSLEEAEVIKTGMKLVLMNPSVNTKLKNDYEKAISLLNDKIAELKQILDTDSNDMLQRHMDG